MGEYYSKMKNIAEEMAASGSHFGDKEFITYVLTGIDEKIYNSLVSSIVTRVEPISPSELYSQMISFELCLEKQSTGGFSSLPSANAASRVHHGPWRGGGNSRGRGCSRGNGHDAPTSGSCGGYNNTRRSPGQVSGTARRRERP
jgi:hypothetical protein